MKGPEGGGQKELGGHRTVFVEGQGLNPIPEMDDSKSTGWLGGG